MCLHCWLCNAQVSSLRWPRGQRVLRGEVLGCDFAKYSELRWRESHDLSVLLYILPSACSWTQSTVTIHSNIDRGLAAVNIGSSGRPWTLKWTRLETWEQKFWVEQRALRKSPFSPIYHSFQHLKYFNWRQCPPWFLTPTVFLPPSPFSQYLSTILCQCILSTFCPILSLTSPGLSRFGEP